MPQWPAGDCRRDRHHDRHRRQHRCELRQTGHSCRQDCSLLRHQSYRQEIMWPLVLEVINAFVQGSLRLWWSEYKLRKAQNAKTKDAALSDDDAIKRLSEWTKR